MNNAKNPQVSLNNPQKIAHYRILRKLGQGGMSIVYECLDERLKRPVALKILHPFLAEAKEYRSRFLREAEAVARLTHPNIVQIFDVSSNDTTEQLYIVTELLSGETLRDFVARVDIFELPELAAMIIFQIAGALEHAHKRGIIHRDIKPENIMVGSDGHLKLMDFGIASLGSEESLTQSGTLLGSLSHLAPEVIKGEKATIQSDIFSLSTVFFFLLTKKLPFVQDSPHALLKAIVDLPHEKVQRLSPYVSDDLSEIIERGMHKNQSKRFSSAQAMADAIEQALLDMGVSIDIKQLQQVLKNPAQKLSEYKASIFTQIEKQIQIAKEANNELLALALTCRLQAHPNLNKTKKKAGLTGIFIFVGVFFITLGLAFVATFFYPKVEETKPVVSPPIEAKNDEIVMVSESQETAEQEALAAVEPVKKELKKTLNKEIELIIWPFADVKLNGKIVAQDTKSLMLKLPEGPHLLSFSHPYAATVEHRLIITDTFEQKELKISLIKSKPAYLVVTCDVDADVAIDGSFKGSTKSSSISPIVIPMPDKTHSQTKEISVSKAGYQPFFTIMELVAGVTKELSVKLLPMH